jgi:bifunctional non-homologous end joining protein LigD
MAGLESYHRKRNFDVTGEPRGTPGKSRGHSFVVQKHAARRLHYDFRLELDGALKSWAIAKGPSLVAGVKRLAVHVEDHPLDYASFEGTIPAGQYGAGAVMIWDRGTWTSKGDPHEGYANGRLDFTLAGKKLKGAWHLVRMRGKPGDKGDNWLLIKSDDAAARSPDATDILDDAPRSVLTNRTIEEIAGGVSGRKRPTGRLKAAGPDPPLTHPDRVLWPEAGLTKQDLADYYAAVWPLMQRHVTGRPLALVRCPEGIGHACFFQKHPWRGMDTHVNSIFDPHEDEKIVGIDSFDGLIALVQAGVLEIHPWGARADDLDHPDRLIFDLDPGPGVVFADLVAAARMIRDRLAADELKSFVKTTGGKGLHVVAPIAPTADWDAAKSFSRAIAQAMAEHDPDRFTATATKSRRGGRIYVDYLRNARGATAIRAYSTRARPQAGLAIPLHWDELDELPSGDHFTLAKLGERLSRLEVDPWADFFAIRQCLPAAAKKSGKGRAYA